MIAFLFGFLLFGAPRLKCFELHTLRRPGLSGELSPPELLDPMCENTVMACDQSNVYRSLDGSCNNIQSPYMGAAGSKLNRILPPDYDDGMETPRMSNMPNARLVSNSFHPDKNVSSASFTLLVMQFGQFLDHDIGLTPEVETTCCPVSAHSHQEDCLPIIVPTTDPFYSQFSDAPTCIELTRSEAYCGESGMVDREHRSSNGGCHSITQQMVVREQFTLVTAYVDGSQIYGNSQSILGPLREGVDGKLKVNADYAKELLPVLNGAFASGDIRAFDMPGLATMHTLFLREHNRIAARIRQLRTSWSDDQIFNSARRILVGEYQNIVFGEYLPVILSAQEVRSFWEGAIFSSYDKDVDAGLINEFTAAAYRFGHSLIQGDIPVATINDPRVVQRTIPLRKQFFNPRSYLLDEGMGMEYLLSGMIGSPIQSFDRFITEDVTNFLFELLDQNTENRTKSFGGDLVARNILRGRDHGLQGYNYYRVECGLKRISSWSDYTSARDEISMENFNILKDIYVSPDDIDLFTGGLAENPIPDGLTGPTFTCIKSRQFKNLLKGDRFFFTHRDQAGSFTKDQIAALGNRKFSDIVCDNTDIKQVPVNAFDLKSKFRYCKDSDGLDISLFL